jgi:hypothetical protein
MIQAFMVTLEKDTKTVNNNTVMHQDALEELEYHWIIALYNQLEIWTTYIWDKNA